VGPSTNYPIELMYVTKNLPVEIIDEFDAWRKIKDHKEL
jgi:SH3-like domain-containing protein